VPFGERVDLSVRPEWLTRLPKVELHLHLEGAIPNATLWQLVQKYGGDPRVSRLEDLPGLFHYRDFPEFIDRWLWKQGFLREYDDFELIGRAVAADLARQRIWYAEAHFSPADVAANGLAAPEVALAIRRGLAAVPDVVVALIADLVRDKGPRAAGRTLEQISEVAKQAGVLGIGLGGSEQIYPPEPFGPVYERARALGLRTTAHAGEVAGPESIWSAIRVLHVDRIDHGTRAVDDPSLVVYLAERRLPVTSCPGSNLRTGVVASIADHPVRRLFDAGVLVSVNTDDPAMFGLSLAGEYQALNGALGFTAAEIRQLVLNAVESCWLPDRQKAALRTRIVGDPAWLG
jgi:adenosine deaminase